MKTIIPFNSNIRSINTNTITGVYIKSGNNRTFWACIKGYLIYNWRGRFDLCIWIFIQKITCTKQIEFLCESLISIRCEWSGNVKRIAIRGAFIRCLKGCKISRFTRVVIDSPDFWQKQWLLILKKW